MISLISISVSSSPAIPSLAGVLAHAEGSVISLLPIKGLYMGPGPHFSSISHTFPRLLIFSNILVSVEPVSKMSVFLKLLVYHQY